MPTPQSEIDEIIANLHETRGIEVKAWLDPRTPEGKERLLTAIFALRNFGGGKLVIGFDDFSLAPIETPDSADLSAFHADEIQALVSKYASEPFDVEVLFSRTEVANHPVIVVSSGVRTPVAVKTALCAKDGKNLLKKGTVLFRTLRSSGTASSAEAQPNDWPEIMEICSDNREADIGRFIRRHLAGINWADIAPIVAGPATNSETENTNEAVAEELLKGGYEKSTIAIQKRLKSPLLKFPQLEKLERIGAWEAALVIRPAIEGWIADDVFYETINSSIPHYSGWPIWVGMRHHRIVENRHTHKDGGWEAVEISAPGDFWAHVEFQRWDPSGQFYIRRLHDDDASAANRKIEPGITLDLGRATSRVAESIIAGLHIAKALKCPEDSTKLIFAYRWTGLRGRVAAFWASQRSFFPDSRRCSDEEASSLVTVPLTVAPNAIGSFVFEATRQLWAKFDGFALSEVMANRCVEAVLQRKT